MLSPLRKKIASFTLAIFLVTQVLTISTGLLLPKPAHALFGIGDITFNTEIASPFKIFREIAIGALRQLALRISEKFISRFTTKLVDKYKIRNFLYYDQVLTNYYLTSFIRDKISDPDLRQIYVLLEAGYITGQPTGTANAPNPQNALIPRLKTAISDIYKKQTGIDPAKIAYQPATMSNKDYLSQAQFFYFNHPGYTESNLRASFGAFQSSATTAAQLEVIVGNGLKAGRFVGGTCTAPTANVGTGISSGTGVTEGASGGTTGTNTTVSNNITNYSTATSPEACKSQGGTWSASVLDQARSFIDNPTRFIDSHLTAAIRTKIDANFNPNNYWAVIGSLLGNFLFNQFFLDKATGVLNEDPRGYTPVSPTDPNGEGNGIDIDGDGVADGYDFTNDGQLDVCVYGGTAPACTGSREATSFDPGAGQCTAGTAFQSTPTYQGDVESSLYTVLANNPDLAQTPNTDPNIDAIGEQFRQLVVDNMISKGFSGGLAINCNGNNSSDAIIVYKQGDQYGQYYDLFLGWGEPYDGRTIEDMAQVLYVEHANLERVR